MIGSIARPTRSRKPLGYFSALGMIALSAAACADDKPLNTFEPRGKQADIINNLMTPYIWGITAIVFMLVVFGTVYLAIKNRVAPDDFDEDDLPEQVHGIFNLEIGWTILPALILIGVTIPTIQAIWKLEKVNQEPAAGQCRANAAGARSGELDVMVIGQQWWWEYRLDIDCDGFFEDVDGDGDVDELDREWPLNIALDDDDLVVPNQLVFPVDSQIDLTLTSRDVIHSYWIPRLNGKRDTVPGRFHPWSIHADEEGEYNGWCTEYCGLSHARMRMSVVAVSDEEFDAWLDNQLNLADVPVAPRGDDAGSDSWQGYQLFQAQCASCHVVNDGALSYGPPIDNEEDLPDLEPGTVKDFEAALVAGAAPNLTHFATRSVFAGDIYSQYAGVDPDDDDLDVDEYLELSLDETPPDETDYLLNEAILKRWIANAPEQKAMAPDSQRGMPAFPQLTPDDLDNLVAYLATLD